MREPYNFIYLKRQIIVVEIYLEQSKEGHLDLLQ